MIFTALWLLPYSRALEELLYRLHSHISPATLAWVLVLALVLAGTARMLAVRMHRRAHPVAILHRRTRRSST